MAQAVGRDGADVVRGHVVAALQPRARARGAVERQRAARARAHLDPALQVVAVTLRIARREDEIDDVRLDRGRDGDRVDPRAGVEHRLLGNRGLRGRPVRRPGGQLLAAHESMICASAFSSGWPISNFMRNRSICASGSG